MPSTDERPRQFQILVGQSSFIEELSKEMNLFPEEYELVQNYPNPFNPTTTIIFGLVEAGSVSLQIYNLLGKEIKSVLNDEWFTAGYHQVVWDGRDMNGFKVGSGIYIYQLCVGNKRIIKKMVLAK